MNLVQDAIVRQRPLKLLLRRHGVVAFFVSWSNISSRGYFAVNARTLRRWLVGFGWSHHIEAKRVATSDVVEK